MIKEQLDLNPDIEKIVEQKLNEVDYYKEEKMISCKNLKTKKNVFKCKRKSLLVVGISQIRQV